MLHGDLSGLAHSVFKQGEISVKRLAGLAIF
jgi:hypothetical protein